MKLMCSFMFALRHPDIHKVVMEVSIYLSVYIYQNHHHNQRAV